ncbi:MAG: tRNA-dihydrouridine synthase family protein [Cytophagales bacterium]|nr:tRNA-dihydrouridine synthase family protein [Armatimonadota bacterium]
MLDPSVPAVILAPMEGLTDAPMRTVQGEIGTFSFAVAEFLRISQEVPPKSVFHRQVPELLNHARTPSGLLVQVQLLGGHPERMALSALVACQAGATAIDINFGCPSPTVNGNDGGATLLKHPRRIREIVRAVRDAVPQPVPVSAKLRLGWDSVDAIHENAAMAAEGGASWVTIHGRTREQGYRPPAAWEPIGTVREHLGIPVVANGDIWSLDQFRRCRETTGCTHFMLGRGALANPFLSRQVAGELGLFGEEPAHENAEGDTVSDWRPYLQRLVRVMAASPGRTPVHTVRRLKQWLRIASLQGDFSAFDAIKRADSVEEIFATLGSPVPAPKL